MATHLSLVSCLSRVSAPPGSLVASAGHASHAPPRQRRSEPPSAKHPAAAASKSRRRCPYAQRGGGGAVIRSAPRTRRGLGGPGAWRPASHDGRTLAGGPHARAVTHRTPARAASLRDVSRLDHSCRIISRGPQSPRSDTGSRPSVRPSCVCDVPWQWHEHLFIRGTSTGLRAETVRRVVYKRPSSQRAVQCAAQRQTVHRVCPAPPATDQLRFPNANSAFSLHYRQGPALSSQLLFVIHMT